MLSGFAAVSSYKAIHTEDKEDEVDIKPFVLSFFIILGFMNLFELCVEPFISWVPFYDEIKCILLFVVFMMATYYNSDVLLKIAIIPFFTFFDNYITPKLVKGCNWVLYYVVVILLPFIHQEELEKMREYTNKAIEKANQKIITNSYVCFK